MITDMPKSAQLVFERAFTDDITQLALTDPVAFERAGGLLLRGFQLGREYGRREALGHADALAVMDDGTEGAEG